MFEFHDVAVYDGELPDLHPGHLPGQLIDAQDAIRTEDLGCAYSGVRDLTVYTCCCCGRRVVRAGGAHTMQRSHFRHLHHETCRGVNASSLAHHRAAERRRGVGFAVWTGLAPEAPQHRDLRPGDLIAIEDAMSCADLRHLHGIDASQATYVCADKRCRRKLIPASQAASFGGRRPHWVHAADPTTTCAPQSSETELHILAKKSIARVLNEMDGVFAVLEQPLDEPNDANARPDVLAYFPGRASIAIEVVNTHRLERASVDILAPRLLAVRLTDVELTELKQSDRLARAVAHAAFKLADDLDGLSRGHVLIGNLTAKPFRKGRRSKHLENEMVPNFVDIWTDAAWASQVEETTVGSSPVIQSVDVKAGERDVYGVREERVADRPIYGRRFVRDGWKPEVRTEKVQIGARKVMFPGTFETVTEPTYSFMRRETGRMVPKWSWKNVVIGYEPQYELRRVVIGQEDVFELQDIVVGLRPVVEDRELFEYKFNDEAVFRTTEPPTADADLAWREASLLLPEAEVQAKLSTALMVSANVELATVLGGLLSEPLPPRDEEGF